MITRLDGRKNSELRPLTFELGYVKHPEGSVLVSAGNTRVLCNVTIEAGVPPWMKAQSVKGGWVTAEYAMLPRATHTRTKRESGSASSRSQEIKRLVGRALRASVDLEKLGERTCIVDCDVIQADGGTRTASISGGFVALAVALTGLIQKGELAADVIKVPVAAISAGIVDGQPLLDLCYEEDSSAQADANFVMDGAGKIIEIQGTAEGDPFSREEFLNLMDVAQTGIAEIIELQRKVLIQVNNLGK